MENNKIQKVEIITGFFCNNNCKFCSVGERNFNKTTRQIKMDINRAFKETHNEINFTGGEPTIRKDIINLVKYAKDIGFKTISLTSNGRMFSYEKFTKDIVDAGLNGAIFSIHSNIPELHDYLTGILGCFNQMMKGFQNLKKHVKEIDINTVVSQKNYKNLPELADFLVSLGIRSNCIIFPTIDGNLLNNPDLIPDMSKSSPYIKKAIDILIKNKITAWCLNIPVCFMEGYEKYSELMELKTKMIWPGQETNLDEKRHEGKIKVKACKECRFRLICAGICEKYAKIKGINEVKPVKGKIVTDAKEVY